MSILDEIVSHKIAEVNRRRELVPLEALPQRHDTVRDVADALSRPRLQVIAEVKRKSPSQGAIRLDIDPADLARIYERSGAAVISVLTDEKYFDGHLDHLRAVRAAVMTCRSSSASVPALADIAARSRARRPR